MLLSTTSTAAITTTAAVAITTTTADFLLQVFSSFVHSYLSEVVITACHSHLYVCFDLASSVLFSTSCFILADALGAVVVVLLYCTVSAVTAEEVLLSLLKAAMAILVALISLVIAIVIAVVIASVIAIIIAIVIATIVAQT